MGSRLSNTSGTDVTEDLANNANPAYSPIRNQPGTPRGNILPSIVDGDNNADGIIDLLRKASVDNSVNQKTIPKQNEERMVLKTLLLFPMENPDSGNVEFFICSEEDLEERYPPSNLLFVERRGYNEIITNITLVNYITPYSFDFKYALVDEKTGERVEFLIPKNYKKKLSENETSFLIKNNHQNNSSSTNSILNSDTFLVLPPSSETHASDKSKKGRIRVSNSNSNSNSVDVKRNNSAKEQIDETDNSLYEKKDLEPYSNIEKTESKTTLHPPSKEKKISSLQENYEEEIKKLKNQIQELQRQLIPNSLVKKIKNAHSLNFNSFIYARDDNAILSEMFGLDYNAHILGNMQLLIDKFFSKEKDSHAENIIKKEAVTITSSTSSSLHLNLPMSKINGTGSILAPPPSPRKNANSSSSSGSMTLMVTPPSSVVVPMQKDYVFGNESVFEHLKLGFYLLFDGDILYKLSDQIIKKGYQKNASFYKKRVIFTGDNPNVNSKFYLIHGDIVSAVKEKLKKKFEDVKAKNFVPSQIVYIADPSYDKHLKEEIKNLSYSLPQESAIHYYSRPHGVVSISLLVELIGSKRMNNGSLANGSELFDSIMNEDANENENAHREEKKYSSKEEDKGDESANEDDENVPPEF